MTDHFLIRILLFFGLATSLAIFDAAVIRRSRERMEVYVFLLGTGMLAGLFGALFDQITFTISHHYFTYLKEIDGPSEATLRFNIALFGFAAASVPGIIAAALILVADLDWKSGKWKSSPIKLFWCFQYYLILYVTLVPVLVFVIWYFDPMNYRTQWARILGRHEIDRMNVTWALHLAVYSAGFLGTLISMGMLGMKRPSVENP